MDARRLDRAIRKIATSQYGGAYWGTRGWLSAAGFVVLQFTWTDLVMRPPGCSQCSAERWPLLPNRSGGPGHGYTPSTTARMGGWQEMQEMIVGRPTQG